MAKHYPDVDHGELSLRVSSFDGDSNSSGVDVGDEVTLPPFFILFFSIFSSFFVKEIVEF